MGELIAVLSGKGGTGKTSVCAGVASALADTGAKVLCIDCDMGLRNLDISLGLANLSALSFMDILRGDYGLIQALRHPACETLYFLTAPLDCTADQVDPELFRQMLSQARQGFDYVFLDAPAGVDAGFQLAARFADRILLVCGPDPASVRDAATAGEHLELMGKPEVRLVVNRVNRKLIRSLEITVDDIMDRTGLPLLGVVPEDMHVTMAAAFQEPLLQYTNRGAAAACRRIASRIQGHRVPIKL